MGEGVSPPYPWPSDHGVYGEHPKLSQPGPGHSPSRKWILCVLSSTERISDRQKCQNDQLHFDQLFESATRLDIKSGQIRDGLEFVTIQHPE